MSFIDSKFSNLTWNDISSSLFSEITQRYKFYTRYLYLHLKQNWIVAVIWASLLCVCNIFYTLYLLSKHNPSHPIDRFLGKRFIKGKQTGSYRVLIHHNLSLCICQLILIQFGQWAPSRGQPCLPDRPSRLRRPNGGNAAARWTLSAATTFSKLIPLNLTPHFPPQDPKFRTPSREIAINFSRIAWRLTNGETIFLPANSRSKW